MAPPRRFFSLRQRKSGALVSRGDSEQGQQADHCRATEEHEPIADVETKEPASAHTPEGKGKHPLAATGVI
jgi:hypothetical protein